jgi:hypothetical protein
MKQKSFNKLAKLVKVALFASILLIGTGSYNATAQSNIYLAQSPSPTTPPGPTAAPANPPIQNNDKLINPIPSNELTETFLLIIKGLLGIIGIWAAIFIILGGFQMVTAAGNEEAIAKAKKTITWSVIGLVVSLLSFSIVAIVQNILQIK